MPVVQADGCPHELSGGRTVADYIAFLLQHRLNAVRLPLSAHWINTNAVVGTACGAYSGQATLAVLEDVLVRARRHAPPAPACNRLQLPPRFTHADHPPA